VFNWGQIKHFSQHIKITINLIAAQSTNTPAIGIKALVILMLPEL
jgi:hypothetical protein